MSKKLTDISPSYHSYVEDQMLTDKQLNEVNEHFEDQIRMSRICLSGVGLACGFEVSHIGKSSITITNGTGITTDGDLLHLQIPNVDGEYKLDIPSVKFEYYNTFTDDNVGYFSSYWTGLDPQPTIYEIFPAHQKDGKHKLTEFDGTGGLDSMVVLLYLECYTNDPGACTTVSCDSQGAEEVRKLRVLLIHKDHVKYLIDKDEMFNSHDVLTEYLMLKDATVERVTMNESNTDELPQLAGDYNGAMVANDIIDNLTAGFEVMLKQTDLFEVNGYGEIIDKIQEIFNVGAFSNVHFQYRYDLLKDIADTYNELKEVFLMHYGVCCPDIHSFPKHLLLGRYDGATLEEGQNPNRHIFYKSPILDPKHDESGRFESLVIRCSEMLDNYKGSETGFFDVRITPSNVRVPLGKRAIPFYYGNNDTLLMNWDFDRSKFKKYNSILGYRLSDSSDNPVVKEPFSYSIDPYNKYRIEGIQGLQHTDALDKVNQLKQDYSLPFDVKVLGIKITDSQEIDITEYNCDFQDLSVLMTAWTAEQVCILGEVAYLLSGFSTETEGDNIRKDVVLQFQEARDVFDKRGDSPYLNDGQIYKTKDEYYAKASELPYSPAPTSPAYQDAQNTKTSKKQDSIVWNNMTAVDGSLGKVVLQSIEKYPGKESSGLIAYIDQELTYHDFSQWSPTVVQGTIDLPGKILAACYILETLLPSSIESLTSTTLESYTAEIDKLCSYTKQIQAKYKEYVYSEYTEGTKVAEAMAKSTVIDEKILGMMDLLNNQLTNICCGAKKIQTILQEVEDRKKMILDRLKFSVFAAQHPGLEHIAGVEPGGTFVMVYSLDSASDENPIPKGTVVADFALPYLCCSDCAPINFIVPKTPVSLSLPTDTYCLSGVDEPLEFNVEPGDGVIEIDGEDIPGVTITGTLLEIDSALFPEEQIGVAINFTVNAQYTDCFIIVRKEPNVSIVETLVPATPLTWEYKAEGDLAGATYLWDFGDGSPTETTAVVVHTYSLPLASGENSTTVTLTVTPGNGACPKTVEIIRLFDDVIVSIDKNSFCIGDSIHPFTITPEGATPVITGTGVTEDQKSFDPNLAGVGQFDMTYNDAVFETITVGDVASANFTIEAGESSFSLKADTDLTKVESYTWIFIDPESGEAIIKITDKVEPILEYSQFDGYPSLKIRLEITNPCGTSAATKGIEIPQVGTVTLKPNTFCSNDGENKPFEIEGYSTPPTITGPGVNAESTHFNPKEAGSGSHVLDVNSGEAEVHVTVVDPVTPEFTISLGEDEFTLTAKTDLSGVDSYSWTFYSIEGKLLLTITDKETPVLPYTQFDGHDAIVIRLETITAPCGPTSSNKNLKIPKEEIGTVSINPDLFCSGDDNSYPFTITGYSTPPTITGPGVNSGSTHFNPATAGSGVHHLDVNSGEAEVVVTVEDPLAVDFTIDEGNDAVVLTSSIDLGTVDSYLWKISDLKGNVIFETNSIESPSLTYDQFSGHDEVVIRHEVTTVPCGNQPKEKNFLVPSQQEKGTFDITPKQFCPDDENQYPFAINGYTVEPTVTGAGVNTKGNFFVPKDAGSGTHTLTATDKNGDTLTVTVLVLATPTATIEGDVNETTLNAFSNDIKDAESFYWEFFNINGELEQIPNQNSFERRLDTLRVFKEENPKDPEKTDYIPVRLVLVTKDCGNTAIERKFYLNGGALNLNIEVGLPTGWTPTTGGVNPKTVAG